MRFRTWIFLVCVCGMINAQKLPFDNYTIKEGLPSNVVLDVVEDQKGYMWFATQVGLTRFDGYNFKTYTVEDGLPDNYINKLFIDSKGNLWVGTNSGYVIKYNGFKFEYYPNHHFQQSPVVNFLEDKDSNICCLTNKGLSILNPNGDIYTYTGEKYFQNNSLFCLFLSENRQLWIGTGNGIYIMKRNKSIEYFSDDFKDVAIRKIISAGSNEYYVCTQELGLVHIKDNNTKIYGKKSMLGSNIILDIYKTRNHKIWLSTYDKGVFSIKNDSVIDTYSKTTKEFIILNISEDKQGRIWFQTKENGILLLKKGELYHYTTKNNLVENRVSKTFTDSEGNIWFATHSGISKYSKMLFEIYDKDFGLLDNNVISIHELKSGSVNVGTYGGLSVFINGKITNYKRDVNGNLINTVLSIQEDNSRNLWVGTYENLYIKEGQDLIPRPNYQYNINDMFNVFDLTVDKQGNMLSAADYRLVRYSENIAETIISDEQYPDIHIYAVSTDKKNNYWIGTNQGVIFYNYEEEISVKIDEDDGLAHSMCYDITCDTINSRVLVATNGGVSIITSKKDNTINIENITTDDGLRSNIIYLIALDKNSNIWVGHDKGLNKIDNSTKDISYYSDLDGFYPMETFMGAVEVMSDGNILFGTVDGLVKYNVENEIPVKSPPKLYITGINLYNDTTKLSNYYSAIDSVNGLPVDLILPYDKNNLVFHYIGIHFTNVKKNRFQYMLENYDNTWSEPTSEIETSPYRKLPPGTYTFKVIASNCDGVWTDEPVSFTFTIKPPFWQTTWFYTLVVLFGIGVFYLIIVLRVRKLKHDKRVLEEKVQERTVQIRKQRDQIASQNREIKDSIQYAQRIQSAVLPNEEIINKLLSDYFILFKPRDIVSGDFYWINGKDKQVVVVAADCTGHGVPGAFMSMLGISLLNEIVHPEKPVSSAKILNELRKQIKTTLSQTGKVNEAKDGMDLALAIIDYDKMIVRFAGAYNPLVHIRNGEMTVHRGDKMPIGIHAGKEMDFSEQEIKIRKKDCIYMFSDGYADQFGGPDEKKFMSGRFKSFLQEIHSKPLAEQKNLLDDTIEKWKGNLQQVDDILIVGVRI